MSLFKYFKGVAMTKTPVEADTLEMIMHSDKHVTPHKRVKMDPGMPTYKEDRDLKSLHEWLQELFEQYIS